MAGYGTDDGFTAWLASNGFPAPTGVLTVAQLRQRGSDYIDALYGAQFPGAPVNAFDQERAWGRTGATAYGRAIPEGYIPNNIVLASYHAARHEDLNPGSLNVSATAAGAVKREKIDVIETEYFAGSGQAASDATVRLSAVEGLLAPFLTAESTGPCLGLWAVG